MDNCTQLLVFFFVSLPLIAIQGNAAQSIARSAIPPTRAPSEWRVWRLRGAGLRLLPLRTLSRDLMRVSAAIELRVNRKYSLPVSSKLQWWMSGFICDVDNLSVTKHRRPVREAQNGGDQDTRACYGLESSCPPPIAWISPPVFKLTRLWPLSQQASQMRSPSSRSMPAQPMANIGPHFADLPTKIVNPCL